MIYGHSRMDSSLAASRAMGRQQSKGASVTDRRNATQARTRSVRVLFIIDQLSVLGGGERAMIQMIRGLSERFQCSVVTFRDGIHPDAIASLDVPVTVIPLSRTYSARGVAAAIRLGRLIRKERIDIVHTFFETSDLYGGIVSKLAGVKVLISSRRDMGLLRNSKHKLAYRIVGRFCNRVVTVSDAVRKQVLRCDRLSPKRVCTLYTGVHPPPRVQPDALLVLRKRLGIPSSAPVVLAVANILPWKGHYEMLQAAAMVREEFPDVQFVVAGAQNDSQLFKALISQRAALGLTSCFHYVGEVRPIGPMYQLAEVFCLLSRTEGLPNVVLEAMAAGTPVVATRVGGTSELIQHGRTGFLVEPGSPTEAASRICECLSDPDRAEQMSLAARDRILRNFSMEKMIQSLEGLYVASLYE